MFKKIINSNTFLIVSRVIPALVFIYAGIGKITDPEAFAQSIINYKLFPISSVNIIAIIIPWIELIAGILLLFGIAVKENIVIINALLALFIILVVISMARGLNIECGCYGARGGQQVGFQKIIENGILFLLGFIIFMNKRNPLSLSSPN